MKPNDLQPGQWTLARRAEKMNPSVIREILKVTERPGIISFAGGLPSPKTFPVEAFAQACAKVLRDDGQGALQYAASEGHGPLREMVAAGLPWQVDPADVLITTGSQQGLDLVAKILIDSGSRILVETPTYLGALQAFMPMEPEVVSVASDDEGIDVEDLARKAGAGGNGNARFLYVLPNFQNPTGRTMSEARRAALSQRAAAIGLPLIEDNPYGRCRRAIRKVASTSVPFPRCWRRACAWASWSRRSRSIPSCCRPSRPPTCTAPASTSAWSPR
jgi:2-aminoadipate transaminase